MTQTPFFAMPPQSPLTMAEQDFARLPSPQTTPPEMTRKDRLWRTAAFAPALLMTLMLTFAIADWLSRGGLNVLEILVVALVAMTFVWVSLSVSTVVLGVANRVFYPCFSRHSSRRGAAQDIALLMPIYNEVPWEVFGNASAMLKELAQGQCKDRYTLFVLSDTTDPAIAEQERKAFMTLQAEAVPGFDVYYRRRAQNTDKKTGNLTDWIQNWGARYEAMLVLDADSLMSGAAIRQLAHELSADPEAGLIQSFPHLIGAETLFGRMQQFSNAVYGWLLAEGLAVWSQSEGNYWGHNAIIRTRAFADSARLPYMRGTRGRRDLILSHDFVEAGMLRRAGWAVRFLPRAGGSFEETPQTLIDYALRDRRWCQGNLQHLRILNARGFHPISRFHLLQGAVAFLLSPAWFIVILIWSAIWAIPEETVSYFSSANPLQPVWPTAEPIDGLVVLTFIYTMLLMPKIIGTFALGVRGRTRTDYGGWPTLAGTALIEVLLSILYAPVMMVQQTIAVIYALCGWSRAWVPQNRSRTGYSWAEVFRFHIVETVTGTAMVAGIVLGGVSLWLAPIAFSLVLAAPLSKLSGMRVSDLAYRVLRLDSPQNLREPRVVRRARDERARLKAMVLGADHGDVSAIAAE
ncbi:membrane glycosyltransferase [Yoonia maricola]|uniref:Glucans biosynthesis glucosyltransferase H n=1 Tax=Yoonia maricola TaxID=420999 RepID=A0A2M8W015_9RHOB|nr:glucans biosynthesis glucosyltransferase MdoH [Yoonia maricola]PJI84262.1 membrane glycosyltransferase [Yoonia maricola]